MFKIIKDFAMVYISWHILWVVKEFAESKLVIIKYYMQTRKGHNEDNLYKIDGNIPNACDELKQEMAVLNKPILSHFFSSLHNCNHPKSLMKHLNFVFTFRNNNKMSIYKQVIFVVNYNLSLSENFRTMHLRKNNFLAILFPVKN